LSGPTPRALLVALLPPLAPLLCTGCLSSHQDTVLLLPDVSTRQVEAALEEVYLCSSPSSLAALLGLGEGDSRLDPGGTEDSGGSQGEVGDLGDSQGPFLTALEELEEPGASLWEASTLPLADTTAEVVISDPYRLLRATPPPTPPVTQDTDEGIFMDTSTPSRRPASNVKRRRKHKPSIGWLGEADEIRAEDTPAAESVPLKVAVNKKKRILSEKQRKVVVEEAREELRSRCSSRPLGTTTSLRVVYEDFLDSFPYKFPEILVAQVTCLLPAFHRVRGEMQAWREGGNPKLCET